MKTSLPNSYNAKYEVSIVIVNYNTGLLLKECISSIDKSTDGFRNPKIEIILVDNASTDGSLLEIGKYKSDVKIIGNNENLGFAKAVNMGLKEAEGEYIFLLNPDCKLNDNVLIKLIEYAENNPNLGAVAPKLLNSDGSVQSSVMPFPTLIRAIEEFWFGGKSYSKYTPSVVKPIQVEAVVMAAFFITPQAIKKAGYLSEKYFMYFEDLDYCRKLKKSGLEIVYYPQAEVLHYHGVSGRKLSDNSNQWRRLIPGSKLYHGTVKHDIINFIIWFGSRVLHRKNNS